ncbi:MAG TPA: hypothetical protein VHW03_07885 [Chthoniobacterales bacterium]|nr:hypothetical protein [Chthoniobacterales bacterium]
MKKRSSKNVPEMEADYDFSEGVRGKYARRYAQGTNVVVLEPDVALAFPTAKAVNSSLRALARIIRRQKAAARNS